MKYVQNSSSICIFFVSCIYEAVQRQFLGLSSKSRSREHRDLLISFYFHFHSESFFSHCERKRTRLLCNPPTRTRDAYPQAHQGSHRGSWLSVIAEFERRKWLEIRQLLSARVKNLVPVWIMFKFMRSITDRQLVKILPNFSAFPLIFSAFESGFMIPAYSLNHAIWRIYYVIYYILFPSARSLIFSPEILNRPHLKALHAAIITFSIL